MVGKCADGVGHKPTCRYVVVEVKSTQLHKAIQQLENTITYVLQSGCEVDEAIIRIDSWSGHFGDKYKLGEGDCLLMNLRKRRTRVTVANRPVRIIRG